MEQSGTIRTAFPFAITTASEIKSSTSVTNHNEAIAVSNSNDNTLKNVHTGTNSDKVYIVEIFFFRNKLLLVLSVNFYQNIYSHSNIVAQKLQK